MLRLLILTSLCAVINASILPDNLFGYPIALQRLFGAKRAAYFEENKSEREVCETEECKAIAKIIKGSIDESVDPCDDFYEYACGNWANVNPPPDNSTTWSLWHMLMSKINKQVENITTDKIEPDDAYVVKLGKKWYRSCADTENIEKRGVEPILSTLWRHGGWPLIMEEGEWDDILYDWQVVDDQYARLFGKNAFYDVDYDFERSFSTRDNIIKIEIPHLPFGIQMLIPRTISFNMQLDDSDENNESGAGSQEAGSREKAEENKQNENEENEEENEIDSGSDTIEDDGDEELRKRKIKLSRKRLNHRRLRQRHNIKSKHIKRMQKRNKRSVGEHEILRQLLHQLKAKKHKVHHRAVRKHEHAHNKLKHILKKKHSNRNKIGGTEDEEFHKNKISKHLKHGKGKNHKNKALGKHAKKSKRYETNIHTSVHHKQQKMANHRVHHAVNKMSASKRRLTSGAAESSNNEENSGNDDENSDQDEQEDSEKENESNEENDDDGDDNNTEENEETDDEGDNQDETNEDETEEEEDEEEYSIEEAKEVYRDYILNVSLILSKGRGIEIPKEQMLKDIDDLIEFAIKLTLITIPDNFDLMNMSLAEVQKFYYKGPVTRNNKINWVRKVQKLFSEAGVEIDDDISFMANFEYIARLYYLLTETPARVLVNYVHWHFLDFAISASTQELRDLYEQWNGKFYDSRGEMCASLVKETSLIQYQYVQKYHKEETTKTVEDMVDDIQKEVEYQIKESEWMDDETKHFVLDKLIHLRNWVGYPEWYRNTTLVKLYFQGLSLGPSFYENILNYKRFEKFRTLRLVEEKGLTVINFVLPPTEVNAIFIPQENYFAISAADLQSPFFARNRPWYVNYGIVGLIIGHEINHGFDDTGHLFDKRGKEVEWLTAMADAYNKRVTCFVDQYNNYEIIKGENFTIEDYGNQTIGDNIADSMGLHTIFRAYKRRLRECGKEDPALPGLEQFNNEQSFFLSFANTWCEMADTDTEDAEWQYKNDVHSPSRLRVIGPLSNSKAFAKAFKCPLGSPMNPEKKCNIWE